MSATPPRKVTAEALKGLIGQEIGISGWHLIDQARIDRFADVTEDHQFIHVDPVRAKAETPFGGAIAHGFLTMSMLSVMAYEGLPEIEGRATGINYGFEKVRFLSPVKAGQRIRGRFRLRDVTFRSPKELTWRNDVTVEIEGSDKPALAADWIGMIVLA